MIFIAHRGNITGPNPELENDPHYINDALRSGYEVEVDVRYIDHEWWLGHDAPTYRVYLSFLCNPGIWVHCKNVEAFGVLADDSRANCFFHDKDLITLTSKGFLWGFVGGTNKSVVVSFDPKFEPKEVCYGVCSDYVKELKEQWSKR